MAFMPYVPVEGPVPRGDRYGLVRVANGPMIMPERAQEGGITFRPLSCGETRDYPIVCPPDVSPGDFEELRKVFDSDDALINADPFLLYSTIQCGTAGRTAAQMEERLRLRFANGEPTGVERGFYRTLMNSGAPELLPQDPADIVAVVAALEQYIYGIRDVATPTGTVEGVGYNHVAYIHATPGIAAYAATQHLVVDGDGGPSVMKYTPMGSIWVFGGGYSGAMPGQDPQQGAEAIWITGQVSLWQAATIGIPPQYQTLDRTTNQWMALAEREWIAAYECGAAVAQFEYGGSL